MPNSLYVPQMVTVLKRVPEAPGVVRLTLSKPEGFLHQPGQFAMVSLLGIGEIPLSISSPPGDETLDICLREVGEVTRLLAGVREGATLGLRGPLGKGFSVDDFAGNPVLVIAGGMGIVPLRSLVEHLLEQGMEQGKLQVLFGARNPQDLVYRSRVQLWRQCGAEVQMIVENPGRDWAGPMGRVTSLLTAESCSPETRVALIGPPVMYQPVIHHLLSLGCRAEHIFVSLERRMECGVGKCGHCQAGNICVCQQGPVFSYPQLTGNEEAIR